MRLADLIDGEPIRVASGDPAAVRVCDITEDSRTALPGSLFIARPGTRVDGTRFIESAVGAGAVAVLTQDHAVAADLPAGVCMLVCEDPALTGARLAERWYGSPSASLYLIGVTGTNGKTTVAALVHRLLNSAGIRCGMISTVEIEDGRGRLPAEMTTPGAIELSRTLGVMVEAGCRAAVMEVSSHALDQHRAAALAFDVGIVTNLTRDHLDYHGTMEDYARAKGRLFELVAQKSPTEIGIGIVNADDPEAVALATGHCSTGSCSIVPCSVAGRAVGGWSATLKPELLGSSRGGAFTVDGPGGFQLSQRVELIGQHNAMNLCQAVAAAHAAIVRLDEHLGDEAEGASKKLCRGLSLARPPTGRLDPAHEAGDDIEVYIDYAHTDDALDRVLSGVRSALTNEAHKKLWVVFGAGGDRDTGKRPRMGRAAALRADRVVLTSDNPRSEPPSRIIEGVLAGVPSKMRHKVVVHADRARAIEEAILNAAPGDVVVVAGKGHETEQILPVEGPNATGRTQRIPFDDRLQARLALRRRRGSCGVPSAGRPASVTASARRVHSAGQPV